MRKAASQEQDRALAVQRKQIVVKEQQAMDEAAAAAASARAAALKAQAAVLAEEQQRRVNLEPHGQWLRKSGITCTWYCTLSRLPLACSPISLIHLYTCPVIFNINRPLYCRRLSIARDASVAAQDAALAAAAAESERQLKAELLELEQAAEASLESRLTELHASNDDTAARTLREAAEDLARTSERAVALEKVRSSS